MANEREEHDEAMTEASDSETSTLDGHGQREHSATTDGHATAHANGHTNGNTNGHATSDVSATQSPVNLESAANLEHESPENSDEELENDEEDIDARFAIFENTELCENVFEFVEQFMDRYDISHDYDHVCRVMRCAKYIAKKEEPRLPGDVRYDERAIILAALLHDVVDKKYAVEGEDSEQVVRDLLVRLGCEESLMTRVMLIATNVSYSLEIQNREQIQNLSRSIPEFNVVQDADRLDALGAIGIARSFAYGAVHRSEDGFMGPIDHIDQKLRHLPGLCKTITGRALAAFRWDRLVWFREQWQDELNLDDFDRSYPIGMFTPVAIVRQMDRPSHLMDD